jgi:hypothetical protein
MADLTLKVGRVAPIDQIADILLAGETCHHPQAAALRDVEQFAWRVRVRDSDSIEPVLGDQPKVAVDPLEIRVLAT